MENKFTLFITRNQKATNVKTFTGAHCTIFKSKKQLWLTTYLTVNTHL